MSYRIVGVVDEFVYANPYSPLEPAFFRAVPPENYRYLNIAVVPGAASGIRATLEDIWRRHFPDRVFRGSFQDEVFDVVDRENAKIKKLFNFIAGLALFIACLGLFGMAVQNVFQRTREISIRKVMGASVAHIARTVNTGFLVIILVAAVVATPLGYVAMTALLNSVYADPVPIGPYPFVLSFSLVFLAALLTVSTQVTRVASNSPAQVLRSE